MLIIASSRQLCEQDSSTAHPARFPAQLPSGSLPLSPRGSSAFSPVEVNALPSADILSIAAYKMPPLKLYTEQMLIVSNNALTT